MVAVTKYRWPQIKDAPKVIQNFNFVNFSVIHFQTLFTACLPRKVQRCGAKQRLLVMLCVMEHTTDSHIAELDSAR